MSEKTNNIVEIIDINGALRIDLAIVVFCELRLLSRVSCAQMSERLDYIVLRQVPYEDPYEYRHEDPLGE